VRRGQDEPAFVLAFHSARAVRRLIALGYASPLESQFVGAVDIDGDLVLDWRAALTKNLDLVENPLVALRNRRHEWRFANAEHVRAKANARAYGPAGALGDLYAKLTRCA